METETDRPVLVITEITLPKGMNSHLLKRGVSLVEEWEETPCSCATELVIKMYLLFEKSKEHGLSNAQWIAPTEDIRSK